MRITEVNSEAVDLIEANILDDFSEVKLLMVEANILKIHTKVKIKVTIIKVKLQRKPWSVQQSM